jgi:iron complex outermembrane receptor protein
MIAVHIAFRWLLLGAIGFGPAAPSLVTASGDGAVTRRSAVLADTAEVPRHSVLADTIALPEVRVERMRLPSEARRRLPTGFVSELELGRSRHALETLSEALSEAAGVRVQQYGGLGAFSTVSLRGSPAGQVAVFLDGSPITSAAHGVVNLADLPVTAIDRVEVYRTSPIGFGLVGPGGAINLVTVSAPGLKDVRVVRGSFDTWEGKASGSGRLGPLTGLLHLGYQGSAGDFRYLDDNGTPFNAQDDSVSIRANNRFDAVTGLGNVAWRPHPRVRVTARGHLFRKVQGVPGIGAVPAFHTRLSFWRALSQLECVVAGDRVWPALRLRTGTDHERTRFEDLGAELGLGRHDTDDRTRNNHLDLELDWAEPRPWLGLQVVGTLRRERAWLTDQADGFTDPPPSRRDARAAGAALLLRPLGPHAVLRVGQRWEELDDRLRTVGLGDLPVATDVERSLEAPQLGLKLEAGWGVSCQANWFRADRPPDFLELFGDQGSVLGNPALRPERVEGWDVGPSWSIPGGAPLSGTLIWAHFESHARDLILYVRNSQSSVRAQNISKSRIQGDEATARLGPCAGVTLSAAWTWQEAVDTGDVPYWTGRRLPQRPGREGSTRLEWARGSWRLAADLHHIGDNYLDRYNRYHVASRTLWGGSLSVALFSPLQLVLEGKNLGDVRASDVAGFPLPGRSVFVSCQASLRPAGP